MNSDSDDVEMYPVTCDGKCGRHLGWSDKQIVPAVLICSVCMDNPDLLEERLGMSS